MQADMASAKEVLCLGDQENDVIVLPSLQRPLKIGMLYDCRKEREVFDLTLVKQPMVEKNECKDESPIQYMHTLLKYKSLQERASSFGLPEAMTVSYLGNLIQLNGAARFVGEFQPSDGKAYVVIKTDIICKKDSITGEQVQFDHNVNNGADAATHVITGVNYGLQFVLCLEVEGVRNVESVIGQIDQVSLDELLQRLTTLSSNEPKIQVFSSGSGPCRDTLENYISYLRSIPKLIESGQTQIIPVNVTLKSLSFTGCQPKILSICPNVFADVCSTFDEYAGIKSTSGILLAKAKTRNLVHIERWISKFFDIIAMHQNDICTKAGEKIVQHRSSVIPESELTMSFAPLKQSPFDVAEMNMWLKAKEEEMQSVIRILDYLPSIPILWSEEEVEQEALFNDMLLVYVLNLGTSEDVCINNMDNAANNEQANIEIGPGGSKPWYKQPKTMRDIMTSARGFTKFYQANNTSADAAKFLIHVKLEPGSVETIHSASIAFYKEGECVSSSFETPGAPSVPQVCTSTGKRVSVTWNKPSTGAASVHSYELFYKPESAQEWRSEIRKKKKVPTATLR